MIKILQNWVAPNLYGIHNTSKGFQKAHPIIINWTSNFQRLKDEENFIPKWFSKTMWNDASRFIKDQIL